MSFQEMLAADNDGAFFSDLQEFWEEHTVNGTPMRVQIDNDELLMRKSRTLESSDTDGTYKSNILIYVRASDFGPKPALGVIITLDGRRRRVVSVDAQCGVFIIELEAIRS